MSGALSKVYLALVFWINRSVDHDNVDNDNEDTGMVEQTKYFIEVDTEYVELQSDTGNDIILFVGHFNLFLWFSGFALNLQSCLMLLWQTWYMGQSCGQYLYNSVTYVMAE